MSHSGVHASRCALFFDQLGRVQTDVLVLEEPKPEGIPTFPGPGLLAPLLVLDDHEAVVVRLRRSDGDELWRVYSMLEGELLKEFYLGLSTTSDGTETRVQQAIAVPGTDLIAMHLVLRNRRREKHQAGLGSTVRLIDPRGLEVWSRELPANEYHAAIRQIPWPQDDAYVARMQVLSVPQDRGLFDVHGSGHHLCERYSVSRPRRGNWEVRAVSTVPPIACMQSRGSQ